MTLYSDFIENNRKKEQAIRCLDEFEQWLNNEINMSVTSDRTWFTAKWILQSLKEYREKFEV